MLEHAKRVLLKLKVVKLRMYGFHGGSRQGIFGAIIRCTELRSSGIPEPCGLGFESHFMIHGLSPPYPCPLGFDKRYRKCLTSGIPPSQSVTPLCY